jgi:hypothetical protein
MGQWASRNWARFRLRYLYEGMVGGRRLLPDGCTEFSARATLATNYGAGFWTNRSDHERARERISLGIPLAQVAMVWPSKPLVLFESATALTKTRSCVVSLTL